MQSAGNFAVLAGSTVTNTGATTISGGDVGVYAGIAITGFPPGVLASPNVFHHGDSAAGMAEHDLNLAYTAAAALIPTQILTGTDLGGLRLTPGIYEFSSSAELTGTLKLNDMGNVNAQFVFQMGSTLTTASNSAVVMVDNNGNLSTDNNVYWQVGSSATLGTGTAFEGHLLAYAGITLTTGATLRDGSVLAMNGPVTLDTNQIVNLSTVPEPGSMTLMLLGGAAAGLASLRARSRSRGRAVGRLSDSHGDPSRP